MSPLDRLPGRMAHRHELPRPRDMSIPLDHHESLAHRLVDRFLGRPTRHLFCHHVEKDDLALEVGTDHGIANTIECDQGALPSAERAPQ